MKNILTILTLKVPYTYKRLSQKMSGDLGLKPVKYCGHQ